MSLIHVNGRTHNTPYISNIETTRTLSDLQFCRYNRTPLKVASTKYEVAMSIFYCFYAKMCACIKMFYNHHWHNVISVSYGSSIRCWTPTNGTPTDHTGSLGHRKNHLDEVQAGSGAVTHQEIDACSNCQIVKWFFAVLYCMANDVYCMANNVYWYL